MSRDWKLAAAAAVALGMMLAGCGAAADGPSPRARAGVMGPAEAKALMASADSVLLLDVREPAEWNDDVGHIEGAVLVPMRELGPRVGEFSAWKDRPVIAICRVGVRSHQAARLLAAQGFTRVHNLSGGMVAWRRAGY